MGSCDWATGMTFLVLADSVWSRVPLFVTDFGLRRRTIEASEVRMGIEGRGLPEVWPVPT